MIPLRYSQMNGKRAYYQVLCFVSPKTLCDALCMAKIWQEKCLLQWSGLTAFLNNAPV